MKILHGFTGDGITKNLFNMDNHYFYLYNNEVLLIALISKLLSHNKHLDLARLSIMLPFLIDNNVVEMVSDTSKYYTLDNIITLEGRELSNYNDRYLNILPIALNAISIMMDIKAVRMEKSSLIIGKNLSKIADLFNQCESKRMSKLLSTSSIIFDVFDKLDTNTIYHKLRIQL
jgi:hypothetical protein